MTEPTQETQLRARLREILVPRHSALLIVDMQRDFCDHGFDAERAGRDIGPTRAVIPAISGLLEIARSCVVVGISTNVCGESTVRDAFEHDHHVVIPRDGVASWNERLHEASLENISHRFSTVTTSREIAETWQQQAS